MRFVRFRTTVVEVATYGTLLLAPFVFSQSRNGTTAGTARAAGAPSRSARAPVIPNGGFEQGLQGWTIPTGEGMSSVSAEQAASGKSSLKIDDRSKDKGSDVQSAPVPVSPNTYYELRGQGLVAEGDGIGVYLRIFDRNGRKLPGDPTKGIPGRQKWQEFRLPLETPREAAFVRVWIHSYGESVVRAYVDDLELVVPSEEDRRPPWEGQYKIDPGQTDRLTPADVVGPDGIVYPNWTKTGVQGGIPQIPVVAAIEEFGGRAGDDRDDSAALDRACQAAAEKGGGAVVLGEGNYDLDWPVTIRTGGVVIRGQGAKKTNLRFRYAIPAAGVGFYDLTPGARIGKNTSVTLHCLPAGLMKMKILVDDREVHQWERSLHSGNTFSCSVRGSNLVGKFPDGEHVIQGIAEYRDGSKRQAKLPVVFDSKHNDVRRVPDWQAAILFSGQGLVGKQIRLAQDGRRGDMAVSLESVEGLAPGDPLYLEAPATDRWKALTQCACQWGRYRAYQARIERIDGKTVALNQPLRIEFPVVDQSWVSKVVPIQGCGVEDLSLEQTEDLWITSVMFRNAWNCWARGVTIRKCGRNPVYGSSAKWCEIRDCVFDDAWFKGGGGTAYAGWENSWDCLMENVETFKLRHAPLFQWAASGNVIRKGVFHDSDAQWHSGWTHENLMELCTVVADKGNGAYGYGMWASPPDDTAHGPNGPRNVVYACDVRSPQGSVWMGGMNENWLILYNRFVADKGPGVFAQKASFDHIIRGNLFVLNDATAPMVQLATPDCIGVDILDNVLVGGNGRFAGGAAKRGRVEGNRVLSSPPASPPQPPVPSIYEWQLANVGQPSVRQASPATMRRWADASGQFTIDARLVEVVGGNVRLEKPDGTAITVPIARLSDADRKWLDAMRVSR